MASLPFSKISEAVYSRLTGDLAETVIYQGGDPDGASKYVAISQPSSTPTTTKTSRGRENTLSLRCHVQGEKGQVKLLDAQNLAEDVEASLQADPLDLGTDHASLYLSNPRHNEQQYTMASGAQSYDMVLLYTLRTQDLTE